VSKEARIKYHDKGFWILEAFVEVLCDFICTVFEKNGVDNYAPNLQKIYTTCDLNRGGAYYGMVGINLSRYITNDSDKSDFVALLNQTKTLIFAENEELSIQKLEAFENRKVDDYFKSPWAFPIKTSSLAATVDLIIQLLNGNQLVSNNYTVYYKGFPNPMNFPEI